MLHGNTFFITQYRGEQLVKTSASHNSQRQPYFGVCLLLARLALLCLTSVTLQAQTNEETFRTYQFDFNLPGARAGGMGGAFIGAADDATATFANPAGLAFLTDQAVTLEFRSRKNDALDGSSSGFFTTSYEQEAARLNNLSFVSLNFRLRGWFVGIFHYNYLDVEQTRTFVSRSLNQNDQRIETRDVFLSLEGTTQGIAVARRIGNSKVGLSINRFSLAGDTAYTRESLQITPSAVNVENYVSRIDDRDAEISFGLGFHHTFNDTLSLGLVWRKNPTLQLRNDIQAIFSGNPDGNERPPFIDQVDVPFVVPDVIGSGIQYRMRPDLRLLFDWQRIFYKQILEDGLLIVESIESETPDNYRIDDQDQLHLGVEYLLPFKHSTLALRAGFYRNPLHAVEYVGQDPAFEDRFANTGLSDENHITLGTGWSLKNKLELDLALDYWQDGHNLTLSLIWRRK